MSGLTSRERVVVALDHREPDRVPVDFGGSRITGISAIAYRNLLRSFGREEDIRLYDIKQQLAWPSLEMVDFLGGDVVHLTRLGPTTGMAFLGIDRWVPGMLTDGDACLVPDGYDPVFCEDGSLEVRRQGITVARRMPGALYFDVVSPPLKDAQTIEDIDAYQWPDGWSEREGNFLGAEIERHYHGTDKAVFAGLPLFSCSFFELGQYFFGFETFLANLALKKELMTYWLDKVLEHHLAILEPFLSLVGPYITAIQMNDDFGAQESLLISPAMYRELFKPLQRAWIECVRERTDARIFLHCDGAIADIMDDFVEIGIDILNPLQTGARNMDPLTVKKRYGSELSIWGGGIDTQHTLPFGTIDDIRREVRERVGILAPGGGFVFAAIHNIQADIPPEKIRAVFDTVKECGAYPVL